MGSNKRKFDRIPITVGSLPPATMSLFKPFYREPFDVQILDISAGGLKILSPEIFPLYFDFGLEFQIKDVHQGIKAKGKAVHQIKTKKGFDIGIIFTEIDDVVRVLLTQMGKDFHACEERIRRQEREVCREECSFLQICRKIQKNY